MNFDQGFGTHRLANAIDVLSDGGFPHRLDYKPGSERGTCVILHCNSFTKQYKTALDEIRRHADVELQRVPRKEVYKE